MLFKNETEISAVYRQCFLRWKEIQCVVVVCFVLFAGFAAGSEKSAG